MRKLSVALALVFTLAASAARAQEAPPDPDKLFRDATALIEQEHYAEAIPMLEEALRLDPGIGTQFNLAVCYEKIGRLGTAFRNFVQVENLARAAGKKARQDAAREKVDDLRPRVPFMAIRVEDPGHLTIRVDGETVPTAELEFFVLDPGEHKLVAESLGHVPFERTVRVEGETLRYDVVVPSLARVEVKTEVRTVETETTDTRRTLGYVFGSIGLAGVATAAVTGVMILSDKSTADERCRPQCVTATGDIDTEGADAVRRGKTLLPINLIAWGVAGVGLGTGIYLLVTSGRKQDPPKAMLAPTVDGRGAVITGRF